MLGKGTQIVLFACVCTLYVRIPGEKPTTVGRKVAELTGFMREIRPLFDSMPKSKTAKIGLLPVHASASYLF